MKPLLRVNGFEVKSTLLVDNVAVFRAGAAFAAADAQFSLSSHRLQALFRSSGGLQPEIQKTGAVAPQRVFLHGNHMARIIFAEADFREFGADLRLFLRLRKSMRGYPVPCLDQLVHWSEFLGYFWLLRALL